MYYYIFHNSTSMYQCINDLIAKTVVVNQYKTDVNS